MIDDELLRVLSAHTGRQETFAQSPVRLSGGFWAAIYGFELERPFDELSGPLVLRVMPSSRTTVSETIVQRTVADQGYPTPRVGLDGFDEGLGGAFMVMQRVEGAPLLAGLSLGRSLLTLPKTVRRVAVQLADASVQLHEIDPLPAIDALEAAGVDVETLGVAARLAEIEAAAQAGFGGFGQLLAWLQHRRPDMGPAVVCHGDIHPFNMMIDEDGSFNMLDWTNANLCRRECDVGFTAALLQCAPVSAPRLARRPVGAILGSLARRFVHVYRTKAPINLDVVEWFETLQYGRCLAAVAMAPLANDGIVGEGHPFRVSAPAMIRQVATITGARIELTTPSPSVAPA